MIIVVSFCICAALMVLGAVDICRLLSLHIYKPNKEDFSMLIVPISSHNEEAEMLIRSAAARVNWSCGSPKRLICLDCGMDDETRRVCQTLISEYSFLEIKNVEDFNELFIGV